MGTLQQKKVKGLSAFTALDKTTLPGTLLVLPTPTSPEIDPGITQLLSLTKSNLGEDVVESIEVTGQQPLISATFPAVTPQLLALRYMRQLETVTGATVNFEKRVRLTTNTVAGAGVGEFGNGMAADQVGSKMSVLGTLGEATPLTRLADSGFDPVASTDSFAQSADGGFQVSDNLIGSDVVLSFPHTQDGLEISESPISELDISMLVLMADLKLFRVSIPSVSVDFEASANIPVGSGEFALTFRAIYDGSSCVPIKYTFIEQVVAC